MFISAKESLQKLTTGKYAQHEKRWRIAMCFSVSIYEINIFTILWYNKSKNIVIILNNYAYNISWPKFPHITLFGKPQWPQKTQIFIPVSSLQWAQKPY